MENIGVTDVTWKREEKYYINFNLNLSSNTEVVLNISVLDLVNMVTWNYNSTTNTALNIKLLEPLAQGASRFEKSLAPQIHWPPIFSNDVSPSKTVVDIKTLK